MKYTIIGPRIQEIGGFDDSQKDLQDKIKNVIDDVIKSKDPKNDILLSSASLGIEFWAIQSCLKLNKPYILYVPYNNFDSKWPTKQKNLYKEVMQKAKEIVQTHHGEYSPQKIFEKDKIMRGDADTIIHFWSVPPTSLNFIKDKTIIELKTQIYAKDHFVPL